MLLTPEASRWYLSETDQSEDIILRPDRKPYGETRENTLFLNYVILTREKTSFSDQSGKRCYGLRLFLMPIFQPPPPSPAIMGH